MVDVVKTLLALGFVICLILTFTIFFKRINWHRLINSKVNNTKKIIIEETTYIDPKQKLVLVRRENKNYLLLLGQHQEILIDSWIKTETGKDIKENE